jgi:hypothetical protein
VSNRYTEQLIARTRDAFGEDFWGFWMLGGMSGGGMGFIFAPHRRAEAQTRLLEIMLATKRELQASLPFAMDPVVYDFAINEHGSVAALLTGADALLPVEFYQLTVPALLRRDARDLTPANAPTSRNSRRPRAPSPPSTPRSPRSSTASSPPPATRRATRPPSTPSSPKTVSIARNTSRSAPISAPAASASR